jgi:hypothetical protein
MGGSPVADTGFGVAPMVMQQSKTAAIDRGAANHRDGS